MSEIRVVLIDDHTMIRNGIRASLEDYSNIKIVDEGCDGNEAVACVASIHLM